MFIIQVTPNNFNFQLDCLSKMHATFCARIVAYHHLSTNFLPFEKKKIWPEIDTKNNEK